MGRTTVDSPVRVEKPGRWFTRVPSQLFTLLGLLLLAGTAVAAAMLSDKELAVAVAMVGTFLATGLISLYLPRLIASSQARDLERDLSRREAKTRVRQAEEARDRSEQRLVEAAREIARLESMRINLAAFQPILKLGLLEVETNITDFQRRPVGGEKEEVWWRNGYRHVYVGVVQIPVKAHLGIDLQKVRVREGPDNQLIVAGLTMISVTDTAEGAKWLLDEVRTEFLKERETVKFKGDAHDARAKTFSRDQELQIRARLREGRDFQVFEAGLIRAAEQLLRVLLAPIGKGIVFESGPSTEGRELLEYLAEHNRLLEARLIALKGPSEESPEGA